MFITSTGVTFGIQLIIVTIVLTNFNSWNVGAWLEWADVGSGAYLRARSVFSSENADGYSLVACTSGSDLLYLFIRRWPHRGGSQCR